jgi:hypothetical protein
MILKKGSKGKEVKELQEFLDITADGDFGPGTEKALKAWQIDNHLKADGIVGPKTWDAMGLATTDNSELIYETENGLQIEKYLLPKGEYKNGPTNKEFLFLHHTAGWQNPYKCIDSWGRDSRGSIATEFVLGGQSIKGNDKKHDGTLLQCIPEGGYGWHLGKNGSQHMHTHSVGIEVCNFGQLTKGGYKKKVDGKKVWIEKDPNTYYAYQGTAADINQVCKLDKEFRGYKYWHKYSDAQIEALKEFILHIADRDNINVREGLIEAIKANGADGFEFNSDAYYGKVKGMWTHTNVRTDKTDLFPQAELIDMLLSI